MNSNNGLILIIAVVALIGGGAVFSGLMEGERVSRAQKPLEIAALAPEKKAQAERAIDRVHQTDLKTIERTLEAQKQALKTVGADPVQRRKLCITGLIESEAPIETVDPAAGLATELTSQCSVVVGWVERFGALFGGDPTAEKLQRIGNLWSKYFVKPDDLTRVLSVEVETAILELRARRHGYVSGIGGRNWSDLQTQLSGAEATLLGPAPALTRAELQQLKLADQEPETPHKTVSPGKLSRALVDAAFEEAASTMGLELDLVAASPREPRPTGVEVWVDAISRAVLSAAPQENTAAAAAELEGAIRETLAVAKRETAQALERRLTERLEAQQRAERDLIKGTGEGETAPADGPPSAEQKADAAGSASVY